ncbi:hypothetical protein D3C71_1731310 [compost metagenome]
MARSLGKTCVTITPRLASPNCLMKPDDALLDTVTTCMCLAESVLRSALTPSLTATLEPIQMTAWMFAFTSCGTMAS